jgi:hypothetical protein
MIDDTKKSNLNHITFRNNNGQPNDLYRTLLDLESKSFVLDHKTGRFWNKLRIFNLVNSDKGTISYLGRCVLEYLKNNPNVRGVYLSKNSIVFQKERVLRCLRNIPEIISYQCKSYDNQIWDAYVGTDDVDIVLSVTTRLCKELNQNGEFIVYLHTRFIDRYVTRLSFKVFPDNNSIDFDLLVDLGIYKMLDPSVWVNYQKYPVYVHKYIYNKLNLRMKSIQIEFMKFLRNLHTDEKNFMFNGMQFSMSSEYSSTWGSCDTVEPTTKELILAGVVPMNQIIGKKQHELNFRSQKNHPTILYKCLRMFADENLRNQYSKHYNKNIPPLRTLMRFKLVDSHTLMVTDLGIKTLELLDNNPEIKIVKMGVE